MRSALSNNFIRQRFSEQDTKQLASLHRGEHSIRVQSPRRAACCFDSGSFGDDPLGSAPMSTGEHRMKTGLAALALVAMVVGCGGGTSPLDDLGVRACDTFREGFDHRSRAGL